MLKLNNSRKRIKNIIRLNQEFIVIGHVRPKNKQSVRVSNINIITKPDKIYFFLKNE